MGPVLAGRIMDHRRSVGRFDSVDQLRDVSGIGAKTMERLRPLVKVS
ncbi:ComEA family DNA-binding protein [Bifidobacterium minimum]